LYTAQKSNSHYAPQPYTKQSVFRSLLNCTNEMSPSCNVTGREFQKHSPSTENLHFHFYFKQRSINRRRRIPNMMSDSQLSICTLWQSRP